MLTHIKNSTIRQKLFLDHTPGTQIISQFRSVTKFIFNADLQWTRGV